MGLAYRTYAQPNMLVEGKDGRWYSVPPPAADPVLKSLIALAVVEEHRLGLAKDDVDPEMDALAKSVTEDLAVLTLGREIRDQMIADGLSEVTITNAGYYGMWYWTVNEAFADWLFSKVLGSDEVTDTAPKARKPSRSGHSTGSASRTRTASTRTTASRKT